MVLEHAHFSKTQSHHGVCIPTLYSICAQKSLIWAIEAQNGRKKKLLSTLKIICKYVYDDIFAAISLNKRFGVLAILK